MMVEDALIQTFYRGGCSEDTGGAARPARILVDVDMLPRFTARENCESNVFILYRDGQVMTSNKVLRLRIGRNGPEPYWFSATYFDPPNSPNDVLDASGGFETINYYCGVIGGPVRRENGRWRAWGRAAD